MCQELGIILKTMGSEVRLPGANRGSTTSLGGNLRQPVPQFPYLKNGEKRGQNITRPCSQHFTSSSSFNPPNDAMWAEGRGLCY